MSGILPKRERSDSVMKREYSLFFDFFGYGFLNFGDRQFVFGEDEEVN